MLSTRARDALADVTEGAVTVGGPTDAVVSAVPETDSALGGMVTGAIERRLRERFGDRTAVSHETRGVTLDAGELDRRVTAVLAVADAVERATESHGDPPTE